MKTHGKRKDPIYYVWRSMKQRCLNKNHKNYDRYGGRGITVCDEWLNSFENFYRDMGDRPKGLSLDRIDNNKGYSKENCRWTTFKNQSRNRVSNVMINYKGKLYVQAEFCEIANLTKYAVGYRLKKGVSPEDIVKYG
jgi:hypothetical protein